MNKQNKSIEEAKKMKAELELVSVNLADTMSDFLEK